MGWIYLIAAIAFEVAGTTLMKLSDGMSNWIYAAGMFVAYVICFVFLSFSLKTIEVSVAYAIWCAFGIVLISAIGILFFHESLNLVKIVSALLIIIGVAGLKLSSSY